MSDANSTKSVSPAFGFILGAVVIAVAFIGWYIYSGGDIPADDSAKIEIQLPDGE